MSDSIVEFLFIDNDVASKVIEIDHCFGEGLWCLLREIVPNPALNGAVLILAREFLGIKNWVLHAAHHWRHLRA